MIKQFAEWLDQSEVLKKLDASDPIIILVLKAQSNHFTHLDSDLRSEMKHLREDMAKQFAATDKCFEDMNKRLETVDKQKDNVKPRHTKARTQAHGSADTWRRSKKPAPYR